MAQAVRRWKVRVMLGGRDRGLDGIGMKGGRAADRASHRERAAGRERLGAFAAGIGPRRAFALPALGSLALVLALVGAGGGGRMSGGADERGHLRQAEAPRGGPQPVRAQANPPALPFWQSGGAMNCAETVGKVVWLCEGPRLKALDLSDRTQPRVLGQTEVLPGVLGGLVLEEGHQRAWVLAGPMAVQVDISDPARPRELVRGALGFDYDWWQGRPALAEGRLWIAGPHDESTSLLALDTADPAGPTALAHYDIVGDQNGRILDFLGREDRLYLLILRTGLGRDRSISRNELLVFRPERNGGPTLLQTLDIPDAGEGSWVGKLHWGDDRLWTVLRHRLASWRPQGLGLALASSGDWDCAAGAHMLIQRQRLYAACKTPFADNHAPMVVDLSRPPRFQTLAEGPIAYNDPGLYSPAVALTEDTFWISNEAGEWQGLDLGPERSVPSLAKVGLYAGIGSPSYLAWDAAREGLLAGGADNARRILVNDPAGPMAGPYLAAGFHVGALAADGGRLALHDRGDGDAVTSRLRLLDLTGSPGQPGQEPVTISAYMAEGLRHPISLLGEDLLSVSNAVDFEGAPFLEYRRWRRDTPPAEPLSWPLTGETPLALGQDATHALALTVVDGSSGTPAPRPQINVVDKATQGLRILELPIDDPYPYGLASDVAIRAGTAWIAISYRTKEREALLARFAVYSLDLDQDPLAPPVLRWRWTRPAAGPSKMIHGLSRLQLSPAGDVLALASNQGEVHLLGIAGDSLRPLAHVALPAYLPDLSFSGDGSVLFVAAGAGGLFEVRRPADGWEALPAAPPNATRFPDLPVPPSRTPRRPENGPPGQAWLPMLDRDGALGR